MHKYKRGEIDGAKSCYSAGTLHLVRDIVTGLFRYVMQLSLSLPFLFILPRNIPVSRARIVNILFDYYKHVPFMLSIISRLNSLFV